LKDLIAIEAEKAKEKVEKKKAKSIEVAREKEASKGTHKDAVAGTKEIVEDRVHEAGFKLPALKYESAITFNGSAEKDYTDWLRREIKESLIKTEVWIMEGKGGVLKPLAIEDASFGDSFACIKADSRSGERSLFFDISFHVTWRGIMRRPDHEGPAVVEVIFYKSSFLPPFSFHLSPELILL